MKNGNSDTKLFSFAQACPWKYLRINTMVEQFTIQSVSYINASDLNLILGRIVVRGMDLQSEVSSLTTSNNEI